MLTLIKDDFLHRLNKIKDFILLYIIIFALLYFITYLQPVNASVFNDDISLLAKILNLVVTIITPAFLSIRYLEPVYDFYVSTRNLTRESLERFDDSIHKFFAIKLINSIIFMIILTQITYHVERSFYIFNTGVDLKIVFLYGGMMMFSQISSLLEFIFIGWSFILMRKMIFPKNKEGTIICVLSWIFTELLYTRLFLFDYIFQPVEQPIRDVINAHIQMVMFPIALYFCASYIINEYFKRQEAKNELSIGNHLE